MLPYVPESQGSEHRVTESMDGHIPVRMGYAPLYMRDPYPAEPQLQSLSEGVHIVAVTYSVRQDFHLRKF